MKRAKLAMLAILVLGATQAAGCIISSDDDDDTVDNAVFHATWSLSTGGAATDCATQGADKVSFIFTGSNNMGTDEIFSCDALAGDTDPFPLDGYTVSVSVLDCPDETPGCPGGDVLGDATFETNSDTCDAIEGSSCIVDLPSVDFTF